MQSLYQILREMAPALPALNLPAANEDSDLYDDTGAANDPDNPIWDGAEIHHTPYGVDPTLPDPNDVTQD